MSTLEKNAVDKAAETQVAGAPKAIGTPDEAFLDMLALLERSGARKVLDAPCGRGRFTHLLKARHFEVSAADILPELFEVEGLECQKCDLNRSLPYPDASFDAVASCSGIHRVFAVGRAMSEYVRVLKPGGLLLVTLPNFTKLSRRLRFLFTGVNSWAVLRLSSEVENPEAHFRQAGGLPQVMSVMRSQGLEIVKLTGARRKARHIFYLPFWPLAQIGLFFVSRKKREQYCLREAATFPALFSDFVLIEARKPGSSAKSSK